VSLVCLDEEGFMQEIERFTKQQIPSKVVEGFAPESGERAQPIAMGRQVLWGGAGKMPPREVMTAAAKAARSEMMQRIRENKATQQQPRQKGEKAPQPAQQARRDSQGASKPHGGHHGQRPPKQHNAPHSGQHNAQRNNANAQPAHLGEDHDDERMPRNVDPLRTNLPGRRDMTGLRRMNPNGQPDPTRTSIDAMGNSGRRGGGGGNGGGGGGRGRGGRGNATTKTYGR
jgi:ATP-dependent RNA helicase RhlE